MSNAPRTALREFVSFDGGVRITSEAARPDRYRFLTSALAGKARIPRGAGLSYSAASFGDGVISIDHRSFDRILALDEPGGLVKVEAGISLGALFQFLARRGLALRVQPGHPAISVGGCIAADVHGKNQLVDGNFSEQVESLELYHPEHGVLNCSRVSEPKLFEMTCGGYGLTGNILTATLRVRRPPGWVLRVKILECDCLKDLGEVFETAANADLLYTWHDLHRGSGPFGKGLLIHGEYVKVTDASSRSQSRPPPYRRLVSEHRGRGWPALINGLTLPLLNFLFRTTHRERSQRLIPLWSATFPLAGAASHYFSLFGRMGFHEYQAIFPHESFQSFARALELRVRSDRAVISLGSAKLFGGRQRLVRFAGRGICLAINLPRTSTSLRVMAALDDLVLAHGGIPNIIKDSRLPGSVASRAYPELEEFCETLRAFDSRRLFRSELSARLGL